MAYSPRAVRELARRDRPGRRHTDVSLWYVIAGHPGLPVVLDHREFAGGRWWTAAELEAASPALFDPHLGRFLAKVRAMLS
jgi:hypothetical protein